MSLDPEIAAVMELNEEQLGKYVINATREVFSAMVSMSSDNYPILAIAYDATVCKTLADSLGSFNVESVPCRSFKEAEDFALHGLYRGVIVDLTSIAKAEGEEELVACSLVNFYPVLRVKVIGSMLLPTPMADDAKQAPSLADFVNKICVGFTPRRLRTHRRKNLHLPVMISCKESSESVSRNFACNISCGGLFIVDIHPERFSTGDEINLFLPDQAFGIKAIVIHIQAWGSRSSPPGIGVKFKSLDEVLEKNLLALLKSNRNTDPLWIESFRRSA